MVPELYVRTASEKSHEDAESQVEYHARDDVLAELESFAGDAGDAIDWGVCDRFRGCYGCKRDLGWSGRVRIEGIDMTFSATHPSHYLTGFSGRKTSTLERYHGPTRGLYN
jgi:hypothetical protein